ncbi:unnamed protein product [Arctia plantaginis]|uniref:Uncharacterized protein n=1 Tax=Arctia plantaginis TaxID=874455 RepID=A0A8S1AAY7_ARCPL|nr:unnamed protein product [Arctia plantaginis]
MSQRLLDNTKWFWCLLALQAGWTWGQAQSGTRTPPSGNPSTVEAQAKFFQDFFSVQLSPYKMEFGHVCEDPDTWEQRYEKKDFKNHRDMGKVRWGDKKGGYGEHYWDLNHAGHSGDNGNDGYDSHDSPYHDSSNSDPYDEPSENSPQYGPDDYDSEKSSYEESGRAKRAHPKIKVDRKHHKESETYEETSKPSKQKRKNKEELQAAAVESEEEYSEDTEEEEEETDDTYEKPKRHHRRKHDENQHQTNHKQPKEKKQFVLVVSQKDDSEKQKQHLEQPQFSSKQSEPSQYVPKKQSDISQYAPQYQPEHPQYVPYENGAGIRQYQQPEISAASTVPRLFLEPSTGHVVDRATGQAYVLQPILAPKKYN